MMTLGAYFAHPFRQVVDNLLMPPPILMPNIPLISHEVLGLYGSLPGQEVMAAARIGGGAITALPVVPENYGPIASLVSELDAAARTAAPLHSSPLASRVWRFVDPPKEPGEGVTGVVGEMIPLPDDLIEDGRSIGYRIGPDGLVLRLGCSLFPGDLGIYDTSWIPAAGSSAPPRRSVSLSLAQRSLRMFLGVDENPPPIIAGLTPPGMTLDEWQEGRRALLGDAVRRFQTELRRERVRVGEAARQPVIESEWDGLFLSLRQYFPQGEPSPLFLSYWERIHDGLARREARRGEVEAWAAEEMRKDPERGLEKILKEIDHVTGRRPRAPEQEEKKNPPHLRIVPPDPEEDPS